MVEITDNGTIQRIKQYLGLRGKAIVSSRNSIYPCVVVNAKNQPIPISPPNIPSGNGVSTILQTTAGTAGATIYAYTVPSGKVFYLCAWSATNRVAVALNIYIDDGATGLYTLYNVSTITSDKHNYAIPIKLLAGYRLAISSAAGGDASLYLYGWIEDA